MSVCFPSAFHTFWSYPWRNWLQESLRLSVFIDVPVSVPGHRGALSLLWLTRRSRRSFPLCAPHVHAAVTASDWGERSSIAHVRRLASWHVVPAVSLA